MRPKRSGSTRVPVRYGLARVLSKRGLCSRSVAAGWIRSGRVSVDGCIVREPEHPVDPDHARILIDGLPAAAATPRYVMLNKPRGLVTTRRDEAGRDTVYRCFEGAALPWLAPVGRLDRASEGLLLFSNDPDWAAAVLDPQRGPAKTYHVQVRPVPDADVAGALTTGMVEGGEELVAERAAVLRRGERGGWIEIVLKQGRNRQIRRMLEALGFEVPRLVRVAIGTLELGTLPKGSWRELDAREAAMLLDQAGVVPDPRGGNRC